MSAELPEGAYEATGAVWQHEDGTWHLDATCVIPGPPEVLVVRIPTLMLDHPMLVAALTAAKKKRA